MLRFGCVGTLGFVVDAAMVWLFHGALGAIVAQALGFMLAVTVTWVFNRRWTFAGRGSERKWREWLRYVGANGWGALINNGAYLLAVTFSAWFARYPQMAVALGSLLGMVVNYLMMRHWIFGGKKKLAKSD